VPVAFNGKAVAEVFLDTGSDTTSLVAKDVAALSLKPVSSGEKTRTSFTYEGGKHMDLVGPARVELGASEKKIGRSLKAIAVAPHLGLQKIGNDVLHALIIGLDRGGPSLFIGD
jgi:hypothetical protein